MKSSHVPCDPESDKIKVSTVASSTETGGK